MSATMCAMDARYLKTLTTILATQNFSKAAEELCITQSAVSQRLKSLEDHYGFLLIDRSGPGIRPTEAGTIVARAADQILAQEQNLEKMLLNLGKKTRISLCCTPTFGIAFLPKVLNQFFLNNSEGVDLKFALNTPEQSLKGLLAEQFDIAVIEHCKTIESPEAVVYPLPPDELVFISAPSLGLTDTHVSLDELMQYRLVARRDGCSSRYLLEENLAKFGRSMDDFSGMIVYDDLHLNLQTVLDGQGVAFLSRSLVSEYIARGELREHTVEGFSCSRLRSVVVNARRGSDFLIKSFIDNIFSVFEMSPA